MCLFTASRFLEGSRPRQEQNADCVMLQLPVDILIMIMAKLPIYNQIIASQTCRSLRAILRHHCIGDEEPLSTMLTRLQRLRFLFLLARTLPDKWVCDECVTLHNVEARDTPADPRCKRCRRYRRLQERSSGSYGFSLNHRHLQLTFKHLRLTSTEKVYQKYLQSLLAPYHTQITTGYIRSPKIHGQYSAYPRVVDGRYLLKCTWDYRERQDIVRRQYMGSVSICEHQYILASDTYPPPTQRPWSMSFQALLDRFEAERRPSPWRAFDMAVEAAFESPYEEVHSSCMFCGTDFSVQASPERVTVQTWQDFGPEGTSEDPYWRAHAGAVCSERKTRRMTGSIRELYGECEMPEMLPQRQGLRRWLPFGGN
ncbi:hypothetical protein V8C37DRAFT_396198 [Trichoderma ceciliae]